MTVPTGTLPPAGATAVTEGGEIYIGTNDDGTVIGVKDSKKAA